MLTKHPNTRSQLLKDISTLHGAPDFEDELAVFVISFNNSTHSRAQAWKRIGEVLFLFRSLPIWTKIKFLHQNPHSTALTEVVHDVAHCKPAYTTAKQREISACFDTVLVQTGQKTQNGGVNGMWLTINPVGVYY